MNLSSPFQTAPQVSIDQDNEIIFVADLFVDQYSGGAELTTEALVKKCPVKYQKILSKDLNVKVL